MQSSQQQQWDELNRAFQQQKLSHAYLLLGPAYLGLSVFVSEFIQLVLCGTEGTIACGSCKDCVMVLAKTHPDVQWISPEKAGGVIKIDQIRVMQKFAYLSSMRGGYRIIVIEDADKLNTASSNALLKVLEEPPPKTLFLLIASHLNSIAPTVLSRCQRVVFADTSNNLKDNFLLLGKAYAIDSSEAKIINQSETLLQALISMRQGTMPSCILAEILAAFELPVLLWFLYLVFAELATIKLLQKQAVGIAAKELSQLSQLFSLAQIVTCIDKLTKILEKLSHNININQLLVIEDWLLEIC